jgi:transposase
MEVLIERSAGLDIHQAMIMCCLVTGGVSTPVQRQMRRFGTTQRDLEHLRAWLSEQGVSHVGMESTGIYWMPVYAALEGHFTVVVGNAHHIKNVPGRKTDVKDAQWLAELVRHGLIRASFVPPPEIRALRDLLRMRRSVVAGRTAERNRVIKLLEMAGIRACYELCRSPQLSKTY